MDNFFDIEEMLSPVVRTANDDSKVLTMAFVNMQPLETLYATEEAFSNGTLFKNLNKPFYGGRAKC